MRSRGTAGKRAGLERAVVAASRAQTARYRAAHEELRRINQELVAQASRLAAKIDERLSPRATR